MTPAERDRAIEITKAMRGTQRAMLDTYSSEIAKLATTSDDPHTPVIGNAQMALAQSAVEYLVTCGCTPNEAVQLTVNNIGHAMNTWLQSITKPVEKHKKSKP